MTKRKHKPNTGLTVLIIILGLFDLTVLIGLLLRGKNIALLNPKGLIAQEQFDLMLYSAIIMLVAAVPSLFLLYYFAWKYRESNEKAKFEPEKRHGKWLDFFVWGIPTVFMLILAALMIPATQNLEPQKVIAADAEPITIQVVSMRWKWVFIYPEQRIATVNYVQIPINTPVHFELTADEAPMSSFWIPNLGGQLYTMTGHVNRLNLIADEIGNYPGSSAEINGAGFAGMKFTASATYKGNFDSWVQQVMQSPDTLDAATYEELLKPSQNNPTTYYSNVDLSIFDNVLTKYMGSHEHQAETEHEAAH